jgi:hypothetical protein
MINWLRNFPSGRRSAERIASASARTPVGEQASPSAAETEFSAQNSALWNDIRRALECQRP